MECIHTSHLTTLKKLVEVILNKQIIDRREKLLGKEFETNNFGKCFIIDYRGSECVLVAFYDPFCIVECSFDRLVKGQVKNPLFASFCGRGYIGIGKYGAKDKRHYRLWYEVLRRTCIDKLPARSVTYKDITICEEWLNFQNFAEWCDEQAFFDVKDDKGKTYHLDKDILVKGSKVYSPDTCCFVPQEINSLVVNNSRRRGSLPVGVHKYSYSDKFIVQINRYGVNTHVGLYDTPEEAFQAYKEAKEAQIKHVADKWRGEVDGEVYQALLRFNISIED